MTESASGQFEGSVRAIMSVAARELKMIENNMINKIPVSCMMLIKANSGNKCCLDCGKSGPSHACVSLGALQCESCAGIHEKDVRRSRVININEDGQWSIADIIMMLEGGNQQVGDFLKRHSNKTPHKLLQMSMRSSKNLNNLGSSMVSIPPAFMQYRSKAAKYYREKLLDHVNNILELGVYHGKDILDDDKRSDSSSKQSKQSQTKKLIRKSVAIEEAIIKLPSAPIPCITAEQFRQTKNETEEEKIANDGE